MNRNTSGGSNFNKWLFIILAIILGGISIYLVIGSNTTNDILSKYNNLSNGGRAGITPKLQFLRIYTMATGDTTLALRAGLSEEEVTELVETGQLNSGTGNSGNTTSGSVNYTGTSGLIQYTIIRPDNGLYYTPQDSQHFGLLNVKNSGSWANSACGIIALHSAAVNIGLTTEDLGEMILRLYPNVKVTGGKLDGETPKVGQNTETWNAVLKETGLNIGSPISVGNCTNYPTADGNYILYISHSTRHEKKSDGSTTNAHWIYVKIEGGVGKIANPGSKEAVMSYGDYKSNRYLIRYYSIQN